MTTTPYFSHDYHARHDPKLLAVRRAHGLAGLGAYWCLVEYVYEQGGRLPAAAVPDLAYDLRCDDELLAELLTAFDLFTYDAAADAYASAAIDARLVLRAEKREKAQKSAANRWGSANAMRTHSDRRADAVPTQSEGSANKEKEKEKEKEKGKDSKKDNLTSNPILPTTVPAAAGLEKKKTPKVEPFQPTGLTLALLQRDDVAPAWAAFLASRAKLRAPNSAYALELIVRKLRELRGDDGAGWAELLNLAVERGWRSVFESRDTLTPHPNPHDHRKPTLADRYNDRARDLLAGL